ncbi:MAG: hypothetical protein M1820_002352 [Bogoriella megaspora]|nr:MAG: hypothetical protein M1820_002352 [Bogoriella megaspora]
MPTFTSLPVELRYMIYYCVNPLKRRIDAESFKFFKSDGDHSPKPCRQLFHINHSIRNEAIQDFAHRARFYDHFNARIDRLPVSMIERPDYIYLNFLRPWWNVLIQHFEITISIESILVTFNLGEDPDDTRDWFGAWIMSLCKLRTLEIEVLTEHRDDAAVVKDVMFKILESVYLPSETTVVMKEFPESTQDRKISEAFKQEIVEYLHTECKERPQKAHGIRKDIAAAARV